MFQRSATDVADSARRGVGLVRRFAAPKLSTKLMLGVLAVAVAVTAIALVSLGAVDTASQKARWIADLIPVHTGEVDQGLAAMPSICR